MDRAGARTASWTATRRRVLETLLMGAAWLLGIWRPPAAGARLPEPQAAAKRLLLALRHPDSAAAVGRAYLDQRGDRANTDALLREVMVGSGELRRALTREGGGPEDSSLRSALSASCRDDFAHGRVVAVRGWLLSATEARVCAIACSLLPSRQPV